MDFDGDSDVDLTDFTAFTLAYTGSKHPCDTRWVQNMICPPGVSGAGIILTVEIENTGPAAGLWVGGVDAPFFASFVRSLKAIYAGDDPGLYVGRNFTLAGGLIVNHIARRDGNDWHDLDGGMSKVDFPCIQPTLQIEHAAHP